MYQLRSDYVKPSEPQRVRTCHYCGGTGRIVAEFCDCPTGKALHYEELRRLGHDVESACAILDDDDYTPLPELTTPGWYW